MAKNQKGDLLIWDTETTGLTLHPSAVLIKQPKIIEFGAVLLDLATGAVKQEFSSLIYPGELVSAEITKITGITNDALKGRPDFLSCLDWLREVFARAQSMCAHNLPFDRNMLRYELARNGVTDFPWPKGEYCTMAMYTPQWGRNPKLSELYAATLGKPLAQTHRALDDVLAMVEIIQKEELWRLMK